MTKISNYTTDSKGRLISFIEGDYSVAVTRDSAGRPLVVRATGPGKAMMSEFKYNTAGVFTGVVGNAESSMIGVLVNEAMVVSGASGVAPNDVVRGVADPVTGMPVALNMRLQPRFFSFGDSISADGGRMINAASAPDVNIYRHSWQRYAEYATQGRFSFAGGFGLAGTTINQLKTTYLPYLLSYAKPGDFVTVLMGQNDLGGVTAATFTDYTSAIQQMVAAGLQPIICTLTPSISSRTFQALNAHVRAVAAFYKLPLVDFAAALIDAATGTWTAALTRDGVHPSEAGAVVMGATVAATLNALPQNAKNTAWLAFSTAGYGPNRTTETGGNAAPLFAVDNAATPPIPTGWGIVSGSHAGAISFSAAAYGRAAKFTALTGELIARNSSATTAVAGDRLRISFYITATVAAASGYWGFGIMNGSGTQLYDSGRSNAHKPVVDLARSLFSVEVTHTGTTGVLFDLVVSGSGAFVTLEQFTILNLTATGVSV